MRIKQFILLSLCTILLVGCGSTKDLNVINREQERTELNIDNPPPMDLQGIQWHVLTENNAEQIFKKLKQQGHDPAVVGLSEQEYEQLSKNMTKLKNYIRRLKDILQAYREYYEQNDKQ